MSDCFLVILRLNPACPEFASLKILLVKAMLLPPWDREDLGLSSTNVASDRRVILRLKSPTDRRRRRWKARSEDDRLSRVIALSESTWSFGNGDRPTRGKGMRDWRFDGGSTTSGLSIVQSHFNGNSYLARDNSTTNWITLGTREGISYLPKVLPSRPPSPSHLFQSCSILIHHSSGFVCFITFSPGKQCKKRSWPGCRLPLNLWGATTTSIHQTLHPWPASFTHPEKKFIKEAGIELFSFVHKLSHVGDILVISNSKRWQELCQYWKNNYDLEHLGKGIRPDFPPLFWP